MPEYALTRNYLELMVELPWNKSTTGELTMMPASSLTVTQKAGRFSFYTTQQDAVLHAWIPTLGGGVLGSRPAWATLGNSISKNKQQQSLLQLF